MQIYKITYYTEKRTEDSKFSIKRTVFCGSQSECANKRANIRQINGFVPNSIVTTPLNLDTRKTSLINFLNTELI